MKLIPRLSFKQLLRLSLLEDIGKGDITSVVLIPKKAVCKAYIVAKSEGVLCGAGIAQAIFGLVDSSLKVYWHAKDGALIRKGKIICEITGSARSILKAERTVLNFLGWLSGVSTLTSLFVKKIRGTKARIFDTRKTTPLLRELEKYAVRTGGGFNHRMGLWDQGFIKDNHWKVAGSVKGVAKKIASLKSKQWVVEISHENLGKLRTILLGGPSVILLDNFSPAALKSKVRMIRKLSKALRVSPEIEASGNVNLNNIRKVAQSGVDRISIGSVTHSAPSLDFSLEIKK